MSKQEIPSILQPIFRTENGELISLPTIPTPLSIIQSVVMSYRNSEFTDKEFADMIERTLRTIMTNHKVSIVAAKPMPNAGYPLTLFEINNG